MNLSDFFPTLIPTYPKVIRRQCRTPIKVQGIKIKLVSFIAQNMMWDGKGKYLEAFLGSGTVLFNLEPKQAVVSDHNPHIINFYSELKSKKISANKLKDFLLVHGKVLKEHGEQYYYEMRDRFNQDHDPLAFIFLSRSCFNGLMRFNSSGSFNAPFCNEPDKLNVHLVDSIYSQTKWVQDILNQHDYQFLVRDWREVFEDAMDVDYVYLDPPYSGRDTGYFSRWDESEDDDLIAYIGKSNTSVMLSTWKEDSRNKNPFYYKVLEKIKGIKSVEMNHRYRVGAKEIWRDDVVEALLIKK